MEKVLNWCLDRLSESSTWRGLIGVASMAGAVISPDLAGAIVAAGMGLIGLVNVIRKEKK